MDAEPEFPKIVPCILLALFLCGCGGTVRTVDLSGACAVTTPPAQPFVPPAPYPATPSFGEFWYGTNQLWTALPLDGTWKNLPHYTPTDPTFRQKVFWWRQGYNPSTEPQPNLTVAGRRLDFSASPLLADPTANGAWVQPDQPFITSGINLPTLGCWQVTGHYQGQELTFVVRVAQ
jgi:hypothetical protein